MSKLAKIDRHASMMTMLSSHSGGLVEVGFSKRAHRHSGRLGAVHSLGLEAGVASL